MPRSWRARASRSTGSWSSTSVPIASTVTASRSLAEGIWMEGARDGLEPFGDARPRTRHEIGGHRLELSLPHSLDPAEGRVLAQRRQGYAGVRGCQVDRGIEAREVGEREGSRSGSWPSDALTLRLAHEVAEQGALGNGDEESGVDDDRHRCDGHQPALDPADKPASSWRFAHEKADVDRPLLHVEDGRVRLDVDGGARLPSRAGEVELVDAGRRHDQVRVERDDFIDVDLPRRSHDLLRPLRSAGRQSRRDAHQAVAGADCEEGLGRSGVEDDDSLWSRLHDRGAVSGPVDGHRVGLSEHADGLRPLAAGSAEERNRNKDAGGSEASQATALFNIALEVVRPLVERLVGARRRFVHVAGRLERVEGRVAGNGGGLDPERVRELQEEAAEVGAEIALLVGELEAAGVQVKDLDQGLIDFPARHPENHETVLLCWHLGEDGVQYWHGVQEGFAGRKPLPF